MSPALTLVLTGQDRAFISALAVEVETLHAIGYSEETIGRVIDLAVRMGSVELTPKRGAA